MSSTGYFQVHAYASDAQLPLKDVAIVITTPDQTALAMRLTNRSGLTEPIGIPVPDLAQSQEPDADEQPYTLIDLYARRSGYEEIYAENIQIFAGTTTYQELEMVPLSEFETDEDERIRYITPPQNL